jgi:hypothetical protein
MTVNKFLGGVKRILDEIERKMSFFFSQKEVLGDGYYPQINANEEKVIANCKYIVS